MPPIVQISQITQRLGLQEDLPQLAGGEFGWSTDTRQLWIGNGTLEQGAPVIGNTEILTQYSNVIVTTSYTYQGAAGGYIVQTGPTENRPVVQTLQSWMDQWATVKDFGAVGDGVTDDTNAINRALRQLYCIQPTPQTRRSLFFPAGTYLITSPLLIPPYATLYGEGDDGTIIQLAPASGQPCVARTADSLQQSGDNIGNGGASPPQYITISDMAFFSQDPNADIFLIQDATECTFNNVSFFGPLNQTSIETGVYNSSGLRFLSTNIFVTGSVNFRGCNFSGTMYAATTVTSDGTSDQEVNGVVITESRFDTLAQGVVSGIVPLVNGGATGIRVTSSVFNNIYAEGINFGSVSLNFSGFNMFYDVGNYFNGLDNPYTAIINFGSNNNVSVGDMFARPDSASITVDPGTSFPRVMLHGTTSIAFVNSYQIEAGTSVFQPGQTCTFGDNEVTPQDIINPSDAPLTFNVTFAPSYTVGYSIIRNNTYRSGTLSISAANGIIPLSWTDDFNENADTGFTFVVTQTGNIISVQYTTTNTGYDGTISYSVNYFT